jgi:uncharacterized NAD-dependent epimerase/dehydratase family protein
MVAWLVLLGALTVAAPPPATTGVLIASSPDKRILVWKSAAAMTEGRSLLQAQMDVERIIPLVACAPLSGTAVVEAADEPGHALRAVLVTQGEWAGCRGVVEGEYFRRL